MAQHPMKVVLLDLDGTLTKSDGGIIGSVIKTFEEIGRPVPDAAELRRFIGPAIIESLRRNHVPAGESGSGRGHLPQLLRRPCRVRRSERARQQGARDDW